MTRITLIIFQLALAAGILFVGGSTAFKLATINDAFTKVQVGEDSHGPVEASKGPVHSPNAVRVIASRNIFRTPTKESASKAPLDIETLKPTELKLKLWGTITGEDGLRRAVIEDQTKREQALFRSGEAVASAKIKMILREKVVLSVNGEDEILEIEKPTGQGGPGITMHTVPNAPNVISPVAARPAAPRAPVRRSIRIELSRLGDLPSDPEGWSNEATAEPFQNGEGENGLKISRVTPSSPLRRLGIRNGDVVLSINDQPVEALSDIFETLLDISEGDHLSLNIKRRGRERQIDFQFQ